MHVIRRILSLFAVASLCAAPMVAAAQGGAPSSDLFLRELMGQCSTMVKGLTADPELGPLIRDKPNLVDDICLCTSASVAKDQRLRTFLDRIADEAQFEASLDRIKPYVILRLMSSLLGCMSTEFDTVLVTAPLEEPAPANGRSAPAAPAKP